MSDLTKTHLKVRDVALRMGVSVAAVHHWIKLGLLEVVKLSPQYFLVSIDSLRKFKRPSPGPKPGAKRQAAGV